MRVSPKHITLAVVLVLLASPSAWAQSSGKKYAVLMGVNQYDDVHLDELRWAVNDVVELGEVLRKQHYDVHLLQSGAKDEGLQPTGKNFHDRLKAVLDKCKRHDIVLVGLAGHGVQAEKEKADDEADAYFCPQDARIAAGQRGTLISLRRLYQQLDESGAGVKLLVVDACRTISKIPRGAKRSLDGGSAVVPPKGVASLFSCAAGESAYELPALKHGLFFHMLLEGLKGKAGISGEETWEVTWDSLQQYVRRRVAREAKTLIGDEQAKQTPTLNCLELSGESPVLATYNLKNNPKVADIGNAAQARTFALVVGDTLDALYGTGAAADVARFPAALQQRSPVHKTMFAVGDNATPAHIAGLLDELRQQSRAGDSIIAYFSCTVGYTRSKANASKGTFHFDLTKGKLQITQVREALAQLSDRKVQVIIDGRYAQGAAESLRAPNITTLASCGLNERSFIDDKGGAFTTLFVEYLQYSKGPVDLEKAWRFVSNRLPGQPRAFAKTASKNMQRQTPVLIPAGPEVIGVRTLPK